MPEGFDPHREIQRIYSIRDLINYFRSDVQVTDMQDVWRSCLHDENPSIRMDAIKLGMAYGFGKPAQLVRVSVEDDRPTNQKRVVVLPANNRQDQPLGPVIDVTT